MIDSSYRRNFYIFIYVSSLLFHCIHKLISGHHQFGHKGLGYSPCSKVPSNKSTKLYHKFISCHYKNIDDTYSISKAVQLKVQGQWTQWINYIQNDFSFFFLISFFIFYLFNVDIKAEYIFHIYQKNRITIIIIIRITIIIAN